MWSAYVVSIHVCGQHMCTAYVVSICGQPKHICTAYVYSISHMWSAYVVSIHVYVHHMCTCTHLYYIKYRPMHSLALRTNPYRFDAPWSGDRDKRRVLFAGYREGTGVCPERYGEQVLYTILYMGTR